jgi:hypothetical protein
MAYLAIRSLLLVYYLTIRVNNDRSEEDFGFKYEAAP